MINVLIVDDAALVRERLANRFREQLSVRSIQQAATVDEALRMINGDTPDIAIIDIGLPDGNGIEILAALKARASETCIIMLTNYSLNALREKCLSLGADYFFDKSEEFDRIFDVLDDVKQKKAAS
jgi:DNA-binding NarL/FixJ family response regulator